MITSTRSRRLIVSVSAFLLLAAAAIAITNARRTPQLPYAAAQSDVRLSQLAAGLGPVTRIKISPDGQLMLVGILTGDVLAFQRTGDGWQQQPAPLFQLNTAFPGFPPGENGLAGIAFGVDYATSGDVFVTYAVQGETFRNRVARATVRKVGGQFVTDAVVDIFEANTPTDSSHQIQGIEGLLVEGSPHVVFLVGEGFKAERALDMTQESGKLMLIQRDGRDPLGRRPYPAQPKIQAIGIRNAPDLAINPFDPAGRLAIVDTGPDSFDRFIYGRFLGEIGVNLGWDGTPESLQADRPDQNVAGAPNTILDRWNPTHTATNIVFHPGKGSIPASTGEAASVLVSFFGRTGETGADKPGREILLGRLETASPQPKISWQPFIQRSRSGRDTIGHPLALERDPITNNLYFADIIEGAIYAAEIAE